MTRPRMVLAGDTVFCTVRTIARFYLLVPDAEINEAILYILGVYCDKYKVKLLSVCAMSTHLHIVIEDPHGQRPAFLRDVHRCIANVIKVKRGWRGGVFAAHPNQTRLLSSGAIVDKIGYSIANPVSAGAVRASTQWPGVCESWLTSPEPITVNRPKYFFRDGGIMPNEITVRFHLPSAVVTELSKEGCIDALRNAVEAHQRSAQLKHKASRWRPLGPKRASSLSPYKRATANEESGNLNPSFATKGGGLGLYAQAVAQLRAFQQSYRIALEQWKQGVRDVCFPVGTYLMRVLHRVKLVEDTEDFRTHAGMQISPAG